MPPVSVSQMSPDLVALAIAFVRFNEKRGIIELLDGNAPPKYLTNSDFLQEKPR